MVYLPQVGSCDVDDAQDVGTEDRSIDISDWASASTRAGSNRSIQSPQRGGVARRRWGWLTRRCESSSYLQSGAGVQSDDKEMLSAEKGDEIQ
jgi:hypothetical protein